VTRDNTSSASSAITAAASSQVRRITISFILIIIVLLASIGAMFWSGQVVLRSRQAVADRQKMVDQLQLVLSTLKDAETGQRGYLLTGDEQYLAPYNLALARLQAQMQDLEQMAIRDDIPSARLHELKTLFDTKEKELWQTISIRRTQDLDATLPIIKSNMGLHTMEAIRGVVGDLSSVQEAKLKDLQVQTLRLTSYRDLRFALATLVNLAFIAWMYWRIRRAILERAALAAANLKLHENVVEAQDNFHELADNIQNLAWMANADGWIYWYNRRWYEYTGTTPEQMEGWGWQKVHNPDVLPEVMEQWKASLKSGKPFEMEFPLRRADGQFRWFLARAMPHLGPDGRIAHWFGTCTDVQQQKEISAEREQLLAGERAARGEAERVNRMKDEFLSTISHELRTPLNAILGWSQILTKSSDNPKDVLDGLAIIERNARMQASIIEDLLDMSRIISGKVRLDVQRVDLPLVVEAAIESVKPSADAKGIRLQKVLDPMESPVTGDPGRLQQVIWNLLTNAIKFTPRGGRVQVVLARVNSHIEITVSDNGQGIKPEFLPHVFDRFRQQDSSTTRTHGGLGLGLSIVKHLVELHGGSVRVSSAGEGKGATFIVALPLTVLHPEPRDNQRQHPTSGLKPALADYPSLQGVNVLVVDDEADARDLVRRLLEDCKAHVATSGSAEEALIALGSERVDVLISDIGMPVCDGFELLRRVRRLPPGKGGGVPAVALTAFARSEDRMRALTCGFNMHVPKPVEPAELVTVVARLAGRTGEIENPSLSAVIN
jgi:PAS domain S-box-containing protein